MVMEFLGSMFGSGEVAEAGSDAVGVASKVSAADPALQAGVGAQDIADIDAISPGVAASSPFLPGWAGKALEPLVKQMAGVAMRPQVAPRAPLGGPGHGVNTNAGSEAQAFNEVTGLAGGDPLQGLSGFKNLL